MPQVADILLHNLVSSTPLQSIWKILPYIYNRRPITTHKKLKSSCCCLSCVQEAYHSPCTRHSFLLDWPTWATLINRPFSLMYSTLYISLCAIYKLSMWVHMLYMYIVRTMKFICTSSRIKKKSEPIVGFSSLFRSVNYFYMQCTKCTHIVFILQCQKVYSNCQILLKRAETGVALVVYEEHLCQALWCPRLFPIMSLHHPFSMVYFTLKHLDMLEVMFWCWNNVKPSQS